MAVTINIPSQVKTYANLAAFPATGALKTIYIAEDTNKTYRWTGSVYTEISASAAMTWGAIGGTLSNQTDLQNALDAKVPTSRTLTINGVTQDLSANRTFTISTGITIGSTAIASGVVGRVLFEGAGNVVQESSSLFWDATNNRLGIGTSSPTNPLDIRNADATMDMLRIQCTSVNGYSSIGFFNNAGVQSGGFGYGNASANALPDVIYFYSINKNILFNTNGGSNERMRIAQSSGNVLINTTTDAGFRLDVNGTARVQGNTTIVGTSLSSLTVSNGATTMINTASSGIAGSDFRFRLWTNNQAQTLDLYGSGDYDHQAKHGFRIGNTERLRIFNTGNVLIQNGGTFTDAGFRLDVNGTARVSNNGAVNVATFTGSDGSTIIDRYGNFYSQGLNATSGINGTGVVGLRINKTDGNGKDWRFEQNRNLTDGSLELGVSPWTNNIMTLRSTGVIGINTNSPNASAQLDVTSTTRGFLPPRMTTTQKNAIASPAAGLMVYDTTLNVISYYNGSMWI